MSNISQAHQSRHQSDTHKWYSQNQEDILAKLESSKNGLDPKEVKLRQNKFGPNKLPEGKREPKLFIMARQFKSSLVYVLLAASLISLILGDKVDAGIIMLAVFINVIIGFYQENKAQSSMDALKKIVVNTCKVLRAGHEKQIKTDELVPGDIVFLSSGDKVPADLRLLKTTGLKINEAPLTGESREVEKTNKVLSGQLVLADQINMAFMGTQVTAGNAEGIVVATAHGTALGHIASLVAATRDLITPLQHKLNIFARKISILVITVCILIFLIGIFSGIKFTQIFTTSIAIAVSAIPEGLLVAVTMILAVGMQRILKKKALTKHLLAAEILGSTSVICTDKTGTLTEGEMRIVEVNTHNYNLDFLNNRDTVKHDHDQAEELFLLLNIGVICNNSYIENPEEELEHRIVRGSPTETALLLAGANIGLDKMQLEHQGQRLDEIPFDSQWKYMMTLNKGLKDFNTIYLKGAPEVLLDLSKYVYSSKAESKKVDLDSRQLQKIVEAYEDMSRRGLRVLAFGYKQVSSDTKNLEEYLKDIKEEEKRILKKSSASDRSKKEKNHDFIFVGLVGIKDPIRQGIKHTIESVKQAGIGTIMITGDHELTATAIAKELGLPHKPKNILSGQKLSGLKESQLLEIVDDITVYARVTPEDKLKIVKAWQDKNKVVAMTGDGINDAPALKKANIGIAVGSGTDVAKDTSDIILLDNNFKTIVAAVKEGRVIYDNIKKVILVFLSDSFAEVLIIVTSLVLGWPLPLLASQIIWVNLVDDTFPALSFTQEPADRDIMQRRPNKINAPILDKEGQLLIGLISGLSAVGALFLFYYFNSRFHNLDLARTVSFTFLAVSTLFYVFSIRTLTKPIWHVRLFKNKFLIIGIIISFLLQILAIYHPFLQKIFHTVPLDWASWLLIISSCLLLVAIIEAVKSVYYKKR